MLPVSNKTMIQEKKSNSSMITIHERQSWHVYFDGNHSSLIGLKIHSTRGNHAWYWNPPDYSVLGTSWILKEHLQPLLTKPA